MNILSCFDGMSCGQIALERAGIKIDKYYASEIDKYAIKVTQNNYPDTIQLGSITEWKSWNIEKPDIILGGSPCQGFSFAGKQLNFEDERSKLFFVFADILKYYKPKYFLLENVVMDKTSNDVISSMLGELYPECVDQAELFRTGRLEPMMINSALVSAQNRRRLYWFNWNVDQPKDKGILLKDIIEDAEADREKSYCLDANYFKGCSKEYSDLKSRRQLVKCGRIVGRNPANPKSRKSGLETKQMLEIREDEKTNCLTRVQKDNVIVKQLGRGNNKGFEKEMDKMPTLTSNSFEHNNFVKKSDILCFSRKPYETSFKQNETIHYKSKKSKTLMANSGGKSRGIGIHNDNKFWRKLTPLECERLQTVPENYTSVVSNSQRYKMLGNGWTVDVISHILKSINQHKRSFVDKEV